MWTEHAVPILEAEGINTEAPAKRLMDKFLKSCLTQVETYLELQEANRQKKEEEDHQFMKEDEDD